MAAVRFGVIGIGNMGSVHALSLVKGNVPGAVLTAVADGREDRREWAKAQLPADVAFYGSGLELIDKAAVDVVLIATPHYDHPVLAVAAFKKGLHVLCEKPAGVYTKAVREMNAAAKASGKVFAMMFQQRTDAKHQKMRELIRGGELGEIRRINWIITDWYRTQTYYDSGGWRATWAGEGGGVLLNQCPHQLDLLYWIPDNLMPTRVRAFMAFGKHHDIEVEDDVTAYLEYANGATGTFITTTGEAPGTNRLEISGDRGKLLLEKGQVTFYRTRVPVKEHLATSKASFETPECWTIPMPLGPDGGGHDGVMRGMVATITRHEPLLTPGEEGIHGLTLSNAMHLSAWTDGWATLPLDEDRFLALLDEKRKTSRLKADVHQTSSDMAASFGGRK